MKVENLSTEAMFITPELGLDPIRVFWTDEAPSAGSVTICCYGAAWTCYFGAMSGRTIRQFFVTAGSDYLTTKLGIAPHLKERKRDSEYLEKIIKAVQMALRESGAVEQGWLGPWERGHE